MERLNFAIGPHAIDPNRVRGCGSKDRLRRRSVGPRCCFLRRVVQGLPKFPPILESSRTVRPRASLGSDRIPASIERQRNQGFQKIPEILVIRIVGPERCIQDRCLTFVIADSGPKKRYTAILSSGLIHLSDSFISAFGSGANLVFPQPDERQVYVHVGSEFVVSWSTVSRAK